MNVSPKTPMALYKANLELVLRIGTLLQENRQRWMQAGAAGTSEAIKRTLADTERMLTTNDWSALSTMPGEDFWKSFGIGSGPLQASAESAARNQSEFAEGLKQAFAEWQQQSVAALGGNEASLDPAIFRDVMKGFNTAASSAGAKRGDEIKESKKPAARKPSAAKVKAKASPARQQKPAASSKAPAKKSTVPAKKKSATARKSKSAGK